MKKRGIKRATEGAVQQARERERVTEGRTMCSRTTCLAEIVNKVHRERHHAAAGHGGAWDGTDDLAQSCVNLADDLETSGFQGFLFVVDIYHLCVFVRRDCCHLHESLAHVFHF